jgi:hypothetical protein
MAKWDDLPAELHIEILREAFCIDVIARYDACFETFASVNKSNLYFYANARDKRMASPVAAFPLSGLLTCKYFYYLITSIKFNGLTLLETLRLYQMEMLDIYLDRDFYLEDGCMDFDVVDRLIQGFRELFGCFWKNPECVRDEFTIGNLLGGAGPSDRTSLICASEEWIVRHATPTSPEFQNEGLVPVSVYFGPSSKQYRVGFKPGSGWVEGPAYRSIYHVTGYAPGPPVDYIGVNQRRHSKTDLEEEYGLHHVSIAKTNLPIDLSAPNTWWVVDGGFGDQSDWFLINYREKKVIEGYDSLDERFVKSCAEFGFTVLHWRKRRSLVVPMYSDEIDVQEPGCVQSAQR